ncbi:MAG TPA: glycoside hydrolase family 3 N-terminal domain-containing protein [Actinocrinis sp.]|nr:glycoside hydrolase family 3 N-terminal domain-containing protein [Actinocrinis sp.]
MTHPDSAEATRLLRDAGAVLQMGFAGTAPPDWLRRRLAAGELGGVALFRRNIAGTAQLAALNAALRAENPDVLVCIDEEGGDVTRLEIERGSSYPGNHALGVADDPGLTEAVAASIGRDLAAVGVNLNYAPDADVNANPDNPVIGVRSFGSAGPLVSRHAAAYVRGLQSTGVAACAKHFPGHGDTSGDSHLGIPLVDFDAAAEEVHLAPFRAAIEAGAKAVMTAHVLFPRRDAELPATMSHAVLTGLLRRELGFDGLVITDGVDMGAISGRYGVAEGSVKAIAAGADAICWGGSDAGDAEFLYLRSALMWAVREGRLSADRLHEAAERNRSVARWSAAVRATGTAAVDTGAADTTPDTTTTGTSTTTTTTTTTGTIATLTAPDRVVGLEAARRAVRVRGELKPVTGPAHVVEFAPILSFAIDPATAWGVAEPLADLVPGTTGVRVEAPTTHVETVGLMSAPVVDEDAEIDVAPLLAAAAGRPLVLVVRDLHRNRWMDRAVRDLLAQRPDAVVVETGLAYGRIDEIAAGGTAVVVTHGASRVCGVAAAEVLTGRVAESG